MQLKRFESFLNENEFKEKTDGKTTDLKYLLKELKSLVHDNDQYKANIKLVGDSIIITHEIEQNKQKLIIKDNGKPNDFFLISGTDDQGRSLDDMGEQPSETIFIQISKYFQEI